MKISICFIAVLLSVPLEAPAAVDIPGLGTIELPDGTWALEETEASAKGPHGYVFKKKGLVVERISVVRFEKSQGKRGLTQKDSYRFCDAIGDSIFGRGRPLLWGKNRERTVCRPDESATNHMIRFPTKKAVEPLAVTNICSVSTGAHWMNHGLIASNDEYVFLFVHTSTKILSPKTIENVYLSSRLKKWPRTGTTTDNQ